MKTSVVEQFRGQFIVVYLHPCGITGNKFLPYYKICQTRPASFWEAVGISNKFVDGMAPSAEEAVERAMEFAKLQILSLPAPSSPDDTYWLEARHAHQPTLPASL